MGFVVLFPLCAVCVAVWTFSNIRNDSRRWPCEFPPKSCTHAFLLFPKFSDLKKKVPIEFFESLLSSTNLRLRVAFGIKEKMPTVVMEKFHRHTWNNKRESPSEDFVFSFLSLDDSTWNVFETATLPRLSVGSRLTGFFPCCWMSLIYDFFCHFCLLLN